MASKTEPKNARSVVLHLEVFYDCTKTTPEKLAEHFDAMLQDARIHHREETEADYGPTHCNSLHVPEPPQLLDGYLTEGDGDPEKAPATALPLFERGCDHNCELVVCNVHRQPWFHVYLDYWENKLQLLVHDVSKPNGDDVPIVQHVLSSAVAVERSRPILDDEGNEMPTVDIFLSPVKLPRDAEDDGEWVFTSDDGEQTELGYAPAADYRNADDAMRDFARGFGDPFLVFFRTPDKVLHPTADVSTPENFS